jgi:UDP-N-acetylmuramoyl-L-alanyl-D-glutamate--2,6-diaminopimelate ligase
VIVDYAHTPEAVTTVLAEAHRLVAPPGRVIVVLGCGGDRDRAKRPRMGAAAADGSDIAVFTNDNPRSEDPQVILAAMIEGVKAGSDVVVEPDRRLAIAQAVNRAHSGDVVVIAGKGHEQGQEIAGQVIPFDDRVVVRDILQAHGVGAR